MIETGKEVGRTRKLARSSEALCAEIYILYTCIYWRVYIFSLLQQSLGESGNCVVIRNSSLIIITPWAIVDTPRDAASIPLGFLVNRATLRCVGDLGRIRDET